MRARKSTPLKLLAGFFALVFLLLTVVSTYLWIFALVSDFRTTSYAYLEKSLIQTLVHDHLGDVCDTFRRDDDPITVYKNSNLIFRITDSSGQVLVESAGSELLEQSDVVVRFKMDRYVNVNGEYQGELLNVEGCIDPTFPQTDRYSILLPALNLYYQLQHVMGLIALGCGLVWLALQIYLMSAAGYHAEDDAPRCGWMEFIPYDLWLFGILILVVMHDTFPYVAGAELVAWITIFVLSDAILLISTLMTTATRIKTHSLWKTTLTYKVIQLLIRILRWCVKILKTFWRLGGGALRQTFHAVPLIWKTLICVLVNECILFAAGVAAEGDLGSLVSFVLIWNLILGAGILFCAMLMRQIQEAGERLSAGKLDTKIDTKYMFSDFRTFSENMNRLGDGMSAAVEERMKSERLRTELITNVSHDIKTPLTSIVNYVDLMQKENVTEEPLAGYLAVLARQSARLKKLIEDLVEASKAATGNISVHPDILDVTTMLGQTAGEYDEKLHAAKLDLIVRQPPEPVMILADGRLLWRVFDNLMNNIVKYAMPGTRVYLTLRTEAEYAEISFRNIARDEIHIAADELLERFTRGDSSRSSEGSGLGLSIANSLTELQGGKLHLTVDGDLFKVTLRFPLSAAENA